MIIPLFNYLCFRIEKHLIFMQKENPFHALQQEEDLGHKLELSILNDDVNTFDHVIHTLVEVCDHTPEQAEQCTLVAHHNGRCGVRTGSRDELKPMYQEILRRKIDAVIE